jgi:methyltransferase family protein
MNGFWEFLIRPALEAAGARVVVEIGSEGGRHTRRLLEWCAIHRAHLHVIEPEPKYDVDELAAAHAERVTFHRATSLEVLDQLGSVDAVLIDGDHNWYTVYHELKLLESVQRFSFPLVLLHDVAWPFARRDMYYAPSRIPPAYRHSYAQGGVRRGEVKLVQGDGLAPELYKAEEEGGARNGVLTAVEDFLRESDLGLRLEVVPVDFGLGFLATDALQERRPVLRSLLDRLHTMEFSRRLAAYAEERRVDDLIGLQSENHRACAELILVSADLGRHQAELGRHEVEVKRLREMLGGAFADLEAVRHELETARHELASVIGSRSWRLTAPLRRAGNVVRSWERTAQ